MNRLPSLTAVRYFAVSARWLSFTAAANELHVTQGAVIDRRVNS
jgi:LysR family glycine cleavage system transcriptional activator